MLGSEEIGGDIEDIEEIENLLIAIPTENRSRKPFRGSTEAKRKQLYMEHMKVIVCTYLELAAVTWEVWYVV